MTARTLSGWGSRKIRLPNEISERSHGRSARGRRGYPPAWLVAGLLLGLPSPLGIGVPTEQLEQQRLAFLEAESALARGDQVRSSASRAMLRDYPLLPYLDHASLSQNLAEAGPQAVAAFLDAYDDTPLAERLRGSWLDHLADRARWRLYLDFYRADGSTERRCHYLHALIATGSDTDALGQVIPLWLAGHSQPEACDPVFDAWRAAGHLTADLVWQRIALAMGTERLRLASYLRRYLAKEERRWLDLWLAVHRTPEVAADLDRFADDHPRRTEILAHGLIRLARADPLRAAAVWQAAQDRYPLAASEAAAIHAALGLALVTHDIEQAMAFLDVVPETPANLGFQERRLRAALEHRDWPRVAAWTARIPDGEIKAERWDYWQARAAEALGRAELAQDLYRKAAAVRGFWGFLAADRLGLPYNLTHSPTPASARLRQWAAHPALRRIEELKALGREDEARREWDYLTRNLAAPDLEAAARIAGYLGWPDRAILTLARSGRWDDLELRFPVLYRDQVQAAAARTGLPESWIFAVIRQESTFAPGAGSRAGAAGLMQLMPATARGVAQRLGQPLPSRTMLLDPATNITLGSHYLARMVHRFDGHPVLATAAYNAGPGRVRQWLRSPPEPADLWIATIPFAETRSYVQRVLAYRLIYADRLALVDGPISDWLAPVGAPDSQLASQPDLGPWPERSDEAQR